MKSSFNLLLILMMLMTSPFAVLGSDSGDQSTSSQTTEKDEKKPADKKPAEAEEEEPDCE